jgi:hypothetical protein
LERAHPISGPALEEGFGQYFTTGEMAKMRSLLRRVLDDQCSEPMERGDAVR